jgi:hypothetical protein
LTCRDGENGAFDHHWIYVPRKSGRAWRQADILSKIERIRGLVRSGLYYLTEHAYDQANGDDFDVYDIEQGIVTGKMRKSWPKEGK